MSIFQNLFKPKPYPAEMQVEVNSLIDELIRIGIEDDYLSVLPGGMFNAQCRNVRSRRIGERLNAIGGLELMQWGYMRVKKKAGKALASHLEYAWAEIGSWQA